MDVGFIYPSGDATHKTALYKWVILDTIATEIKNNITNNSSKHIMLSN